MCGTPNILAFSAFSQQAFHQHRVISQRCRQFDDDVEPLVVAHRRNIQLSADSFFFQGDGFRCARLKVKDLLIYRAQIIKPVTVVCASHA